MDRQKLFEAFDACRPLSQDLAQPEMAEALRQMTVDAEAAELQSRLHAWEGPLAAAMHDVPVTAGLADRIIERLLAVAPAESVAALAVPEAVAAPVESAQIARAAVPPAKSSRRGWLWGALATAACVLVALGLSRWLQPDELRSDDVLAQASRWYQSLAQQAWKPMEAAPRGFDLPRSVLAAARRWQAVERGVVYDLSSPRLGKAVVFVLKLATRGLPELPPRQPQSTTGGQGIAAWQADGRLFVVVVQLDGDPERYRRLVDAASPPLA